MKQTAVLLGLLLVLSPASATARGGARGFSGGSVRYASGRSYAPGASTQSHYTSGSGSQGRIQYHGGTTGGTSSYGSYRTAYGQATGSHGRSVEVGARQYTTKSGVTVTAAGGKTSGAYGQSATRGVVTATGPRGNTVTRPYRFQAGGAPVAVVPTGYSEVYVGSQPYYTDNNTWYAPTDDGSYAPVEDPNTQSVTTLPPDVVNFTVDGKTYYFADGIYYKAQDVDGQIQYVPTTP
jgi:hypothetical protein